MTAPLEAFPLTDLDHFEAGNHRLPCPSCGRGPCDKTLGLTVATDGQAVWHCFRCNLTGHRWPEQAARMSSGPKILLSSKASEMHDSLSSWGRGLWSDCSSISGVARAYLAARCCVIPPADGDLRWHSALKHPTGHVGPALVARITDAVTGEALSLHRTWINPNGTKADVDPPRLLLGGHRKQGGVIRLWPDEAITSGLAVAEGVETALCVAWAFQPVWSCVDAGNLAKLAVLPGIDALVIGADNDSAGLSAAEECARRWVTAGASVRVAVPGVVAQ